MSTSHVSQCSWGWAARHVGGRHVLTDFRIEEAEQKIGAGLIEEVVQVAEGELELVKVMAENKVYVLCVPSLRYSISPGLIFSSVLWMV